MNWTAILLLFAAGFTPVATFLACCWWHDRKMTASDREAERLAWKGRYDRRCRHD